MKRLHILHEELMRNHVICYLQNKSCQIGKFCLLLRRHVFLKLMGTVRFSRAGLNSYGPQDYELSPDPPEKGWSLTGRDGLSPGLPERYENISL